MTRTYRSGAAALVACLVLTATLLAVWAEAPVPQDDPTAVTAATAAEVDTAIAAAQRDGTSDVVIANRSVTAAQIERAREFFPEGRLILDSLLRNGDIHSRTYIDLDHKREVFDEEYGIYFDHYEPETFTVGFTPGGSDSSELAESAAYAFDYFFQNDVIYTFELAHKGEAPGRVHTTVYLGPDVEAPLYGYMFYPEDNFYTPVHCYVDSVGCIHVEYTESGGVLVFSDRMLQRK